MRGDFINLLSANDLDHLRNALLRMERVELLRQMGGTTLTARTMPGGKSRTVAMIVQVRVDTPRMTWIKNCESIEELIECLETHTRLSCWPQKKQSQKRSAAG